MRSFRWTAFACALTALALFVPRAAAATAKAAVSGGPKADVTSGSAIKPGKKGGVLT